MEGRKRTVLIKGEEYRGMSLVQHLSSKILVAEDEYDILASYKEALEMANHRVYTTQDGEECLKIYLKEFKKTKKDDPTQTSPFDVVVLDHNMPKKNGHEVAKKILALAPHQRIIFASGYVEGTVADSIKKLGKIVEVIKKPFTLSLLIDLIEDKEIYAELEKLNVSVRNLKGIDPTHEQVQSYLEILKVLQGGK